MRQAHFHNYCRFDRWPPDFMNFGSTDVFNALDESLLYLGHEEVDGARMSRISYVERVSKLV